MSQANKQSYRLPASAEEVIRFESAPAEWAREQLRRAATGSAEPLIKVVSDLMGIENFDIDGVKRDHLIFLLFTALYKLQEETAINQVMCEQLYDDQMAEVETPLRVDELIAELQRYSKTI